MADDNSYRKAKELAYTALAHKSCLVAQLIDKLVEKGIEIHIAEKVVEECRALGYLDDNAWIDSYVRRQLDRKDGPRKIAEKLRQKGISSSASSEAFSTHCTADSQQQLINTLLETRYRRRDLTDFKEKQKVVAALMRKGFSYPSIAEALRLNSSIDDDF